MLEPKPNQSRDSSKSSRSPHRVSTDPTAEQTTKRTRPRFKKRIIVCSDGTWQDGLATSRSQYSNVLRLARALDHEDTRQDTEGLDISEGSKSRIPIQQIVYYQSGVGTDNNPWSHYVEGATGSSLAEKVEDLYGFIAHNYCPGDDIYLFGFSRGAYTVRMAALLIGEIGVLDRKDMDNFSTIFKNYQKRGMVKDQAELQQIEKDLSDWVGPYSKGRRRVDIDGDGFTIKCVGVWDTVGAVGMPDELLIKDPTGENALFGFKNAGKLGTHIQHAFQALALDERRKDFDCNRWEQHEEGRKKGQVLKQCWFSGSHSDVGGGYDDHDLSDIALLWMAANIESMLSLDIGYFECVIEPVAKWGEQEPHDSCTGVFALAQVINRKLPTKVNESTNEYIHPSVLGRIALYPTLEPVIKSNPELVCELMALEKQFKKFWENAYDPEAQRSKTYQEKLAKIENTVPDSGSAGIGARISRIFSTIRRNASTSKRQGGMEPKKQGRISGDPFSKAGPPQALSKTRPAIPRKST